MKSFKKIKHVRQSLRPCLLVAQRLSFSLILLYTSCCVEKKNYIFQGIALPFFHLKRLLLTLTIFELFYFYPALSRQRTRFLSYPKTLRYPFDELCFKTRPMILTYLRT